MKYWSEKFRYLMPNFLNWIQWFLFVFHFVLIYPLYFPTNIEWNWMQICYSFSSRPIYRYLSASADISVIGRYIGFTNRKAYRYPLSVSADMEAHIGSTTDMKITPFFSQNFLILTKETCEKFHFFLDYFQFSAV